MKFDILFQDIVWLCIKNIYCTDSKVYYDKKKTFRKIFIFTVLEFRHNTVAPLLPDLLEVPLDNVLQNNYTIYWDY